MLIDVPATLTAVRNAVTALGGEVAVFEIGPRATPAQIQAVERDLGLAIPDTLRRLFLEQAATLRLSWTLEPGAPLPKMFQNGLAGAIDLSLAELPLDLENWSGWRAAFEDPAAHGWPTEITLEDYDEAFPVVAAANGDQLVVTDPERNPSDVVVYLNHEAGDFNFVILADTLEGFLNTWVPLGCPGPEWWELAPFIDTDTLKLSLTTRRARAWRRAIAKAS